MGFVNMVSFLGATMGPYLVGLLMDWFGHTRAFLSIPLIYALTWGVIALEEKVGGKSFSRT